MNNLPKWGWMGYTACFVCSLLGSVAPLLSCVQPVDVARSIIAAACNSVVSEASAEEETLILHADKSFYRDRSEPEEALVGFLRRAPVRTGPNTRDMPFKLETDQGTFSVYVTGADVARLHPFKDHKVRVVGKRIDQRAEGFGYEFWIASIIELRP